MRDPDERYLEQRANARFGIMRHAAIYAPSALLLTGLLVWAIPALPGSIIAVVLLSIGALAVNVEAYHSIADLMAKEPVTTRGQVDRMWSKGRFLFIGRARYLLVAGRTVRPDGTVDMDRKPSGRLFEIGPVAEFELDVDDEVEVVHWPHTNTIVTLEKVASASDQPMPPGQSPGGSSSLDWGGRR